jgi:hypothetical protein
MDNPWHKLPREPRYVLSEDAFHLNQFNSRPRLKDEHKIRLEVFPEPYLGNPASPVVLLNLNPGFKETDIQRHHEPRFAELSRGNLLHLPAEFPFYLLDPTIDRTGWWEKKLAALIDRFDQRTVANSVFCIEYFPYHSCKFKRSRQVLDSQRYSFSLVREAIQRKAVILIMRARRRWYEQIPELESYAMGYVVSSWQNPVITENNFGEGFGAAVAAIAKFEDMRRGRSERSSDTVPSRRPRSGASFELTSPNAASPASAGCPNSSAD